MRVLAEVDVTAQEAEDFRQAVIARGGDPDSTTDSVDYRIHETRKYRVMMRAGLEDQFNNWVRLLHDELKVLSLSVDADESELNDADKAVGSAEGYEPVDQTAYLYGYARPRMWQQYGDDHRGVCLVFDKSRLLAALEQGAANPYRLLDQSHRHGGPSRGPGHLAGDRAVVVDQNGPRLIADERP